MALKIKKQKIKSKAMQALQQEKFEKAIELCKKEILQSPKKIELYVLAAYACRRLKDYAQEESFYHQGLAVEKNLNLYKDLIDFYVRTNRNSMALELCDTLVDLFPDDAEAYHLVAKQKEKQGEHSEAFRLAKKAVSIEPQNANLLSNLSELAIGKKEKKEVEDLMLAACQQDPDSLMLYACLGFFYYDNKRYLQAFEAMKKAHNFGFAQYMQLYGAYWDGFDETGQKLVEHMEKGKVELFNCVTPFASCHLPQLDGLQQLKYNRRFAELDINWVLDVKPYKTKVADSKRLRIGYLSADFVLHATMRLFSGVLNLHDQENFDIHLLSHSPVRYDEYTDRIKAYPVTFHDLNHMNDEEAARYIADLDLHIIVEMKGYTQDNRLKIVARRPAPVIASWLGFPGTLGVPGLADYIIGDPLVTPLEHEAHFCEKIAQMPHSYQSNDNTNAIPHPPTRATVGLPEDAFVFCSFNTFRKLIPDVFKMWCKLLNNVPDSILWMLEPDEEEAKNNIYKEAAKFGIPQDRIIFANMLSLDAHTARLQLADLALDSFPYNSHTTGSDTLWAGVPFVAITGKTFASRVAASLLTAMECPELIAHSIDEAYEMTLALAQDRKRLADVRAKLVEKRKTAPLFDTQRFTRNMERLFRQMWQNHLDGKHDHIILPSEDETILHSQVSDSSNTHLTYEDALKSYETFAYGKAKVECETILQSDPDNIRVKHLLAQTLKLLNFKTEAMDLWHDLLKQDQLDHEEREDAFFNLGQLYLGEERHEEAEKLYHDFIKAFPENAHALCGMGLVMQRTAKLDKAEEYFKRALELNPTHMAATIALAFNYIETGKLGSAEILLKNAIETQPEGYVYTKILAELYEKTGSLEPALFNYSEAKNWAKTQELMRRLGVWDSLSKTDELFIDNIEQEELNKDNIGNPFSALNIRRINNKQFLEYSHRYVSLLHGAAMENKPLYQENHSRDKLRIGYLAADFHYDTQHNQLKNILSLHDNNMFDIHLLSGFSHDDGTNAASGSSHLPIHELYKMSDSKAAEFIASKNFDILVNLDGNDTISRGGIMALRPAPVLVNGFGYAGTVGHPNIAHYIIGDPVVTPIDAGHDFSETLALMPHCFMPVSPFALQPTPPSRSQAGLPEGVVVFACFSDLAKIDPDQFDLWARLLLSVDDSVLWMLDPVREFARGNIKKELANRGIDEKRLILAPRLAYEQHLARLQLADIMLDTFPHTASHTAAEAIYAGIPLVSLKGKTFASRMSSSVLMANNCPVLVADTADEWFSLNFHLATNDELRATLKQELKVNSQNSPLFDNKRYIRDLERLYQNMWEQHQLGKREAIVLDPQ